MIETPRGMAVEILNRVEATGAYAEPLLDSCLSGRYMPNIHDRRLLALLVYGVLRMRAHLDWIIKSLYRGRLSSLSVTVKNIMRTALYQLMYTDRIPVFAVVDEAVKLAKLLEPKSAGLVNAVLRTFLRKKGTLVYPSRENDLALHLSVCRSHPLWLVKRWLKIMGEEETEALCRADNEIPPVTLRINRLKAGRGEVIEELRKGGFEARETIYSPDGVVAVKSDPLLRETSLFKEGKAIFQDEASQLIAHLAAPEPGERILDICCGTGVKTTHLAEIMQNKGQITALDINGKKIARLEELAARFGISIVETLERDAGEELGPEFHGRYDRVLVDAPCSGLGTLRRNPEIKWRLRAGDMGAFAGLQKRILDRAALYVKQGGLIVYSVCSLMPEENEEVAADFLARRGDFRTMPPPASIGGGMADEKGFFRTSPAKQGTDGFFAWIGRKS